MTEHQVHLNAFAYLSEYGQSDCGLKCIKQQIETLTTCNFTAHQSAIVI
jgi:hypothetical protein